MKPHPNLKRFLWVIYYSACMFIIISGTTWIYLNLQDQLERNPKWVPIHELNSICWVRALRELERIESDPLVTHAKMVLGTRNKYGHTWIKYLRKDPETEETKEIEYDVTFNQYVNGSTLDDSVFIIHEQDKTIHYCSVCDKSMTYIKDGVYISFIGFKAIVFDEQENKDYSKFMKTQLGKYELDKDYEICWECWLKSMDVKP